MKLDVIYDNDGFDVEDLVKILKKGKLSNKDFKMKKSESGFIGDIEENTHFTKKVKPVKNEVLSEKAFSKYPEHFTIGVFNAARGAGATWAVINIARYLAMHGYKTSILDMSSTKAVSTLKIKNIDIYSSETNIDELKKQYNVTVIDFGTPIEISPNGENFKLMNHYKPETIQCFTGCNIKLIMGFSDSWNIQKINFFFINDTWRSQFDNSYMFIITGDPQKIKPLFPNGNFFSKEDDYREYILEAMRREEL